MRQVQSQQSENDRNNVVQVNPGGPFKSVTVKVTNSRIKSGGTLSNITNNGLVGIYIDNPEAGWKGPVTVDLSDAHIEAWVSREYGRVARGVQIGMRTGNSNVATVRLKGPSDIEIANNVSSLGTGSRILTRVAGRLHTVGNQSPGVFVEYARGGGSVRVNTPLEIRTNGQRSPGIRAELAQVVDPLQDRTKTASWDGISLGNAIWSVYAAGVTSPARLWGGTGPTYTYSDSTGLTLAQMELFFRFGRTKGGCLDDGTITATSATDCSAAAQYVAPVPADTEVNEIDYTTQLNAAGKTPFDSPDTGVAAGTGPMARLQHQFPNRYANRVAIADVLKAMRELPADVVIWNRYREYFAFTDNYAVHVTHGDHQADAGIVYEVGSGTKIYTSGDRSPGIGAFVKVGDDAATNAIQTFVRIGDSSDFSGRGTQGEARFIVDEPIATEATTGSGSHGIVVISTGVVTAAEAAADSSLTADDIPGASHPLYGRDWDVDTPRRNIQIDVREDVTVNAADNYGIALMGAEGTTSRVTVAEGATVGQATATGGGMLFWKAADTVVNRGTIRGKTDFHDGNDRLDLQGLGMVTGTAGTDTLDFGDGEDTLELVGGTIDIGVLNLETMIKSTTGDAEVGAVTFAATGGTMELRAGRLIVKGHVNVGSGTVTVKEDAELVIEATGAAATNTLLGRITATGGITFEGKKTTDELVSILTTATGTAAADLAYARSNWLGTGTNVMAGTNPVTLAPGNYDQLMTAITKKTAIVVRNGESMEAITYAAESQAVTVQGTVNGAIDLGAGDDTLEVDGGTVYGAVDMGTGADTITLRSGEIRGAVTKVASMVKEGSGIATVGDVSFSSSTLMVKDGQLFITGHLDLSGGDTTDATDVVTVESGGRIVIVADGPSHGRITAHTIDFKDASPSVQFLGLNAATHEADVATARDNWLVRGSSTRLLAAGAEITSDGLGYETLDEDPRPQRTERPRPTPRPAAGTASDSDSNSFYAIGAVAILWLIMRDDDDCCALVDYESDGATATFAGVKGAEQFRSGGVRTWAKLYSDSVMSSQQGLAVGMDSKIGEHGYFGVSAMPNASGTANTQGLSLNRRTSFEGGRYEAKGGWQKDSMFASVRLSHGEFRGSTSFRNLFEAGGQLGGSFDMTHSHLELGAGMQLSAGEQMTLVPSLGVYGGSMKQGGHAASNAVLVADVPGYSQSYQGWRAGLQLKSSDWLSVSDSTKVRPQLGFNVYRTHTSGPGSMNMNQRDQLGILNFTNKLRVRGLPTTVNAFKAGLSMKNSSGMNVKLNYVGYEAGGKLQHGAIARMQVRF